jgi:glucose-1-phosphate adenylyltransferase
MVRSDTIAKNTLALVLAGGQGERLYPLTRDRSKPAVPFGGTFRIIDFTLSNCLNSGLRKIYVLTQYKSGSLERHIKLGWNPLFSSELDECIDTVPPQLRVGQRWYEGTADAVFQNIYLLERERPARVVILSGDHIYKMDYQKMVDFHREKGAVATVAAMEVPRAEACAFGVLHVNEDSRIVSFVEKPDDPPAIPGQYDYSLVNMGIYVFETEALVQALREDAAKQETRHDFGYDVLPSLLEHHGLYAYPFVDENRKETRFWRDIGTIDAYYEASMDLVAVDPVFNLYDQRWPIRTYPRQLPPAKTVFAQEEAGGRLGIALDSLICGGVVVSGGRVERSILSPNVRISSHARVSDSVLLDGVVVKRHAVVQHAIVEMGVTIPERAVIGVEPEEDRRRFEAEGELIPEGPVASMRPGEGRRRYRVTEKGVVVVTRDDPVE